MSGACGGNNNWGDNGVMELTNGQEVTLRVNYNGGHQSNANEFRMAFTCGAPGNQGALEVSDSNPPRTPAVVATIERDACARGGRRGNASRRHASHTLPHRRLPFTTPARATASRSRSARTAARATSRAARRTVSGPPPPLPLLPPAAPVSSRHPEMAIDTYVSSRDPAAGARDPSSRGDRGDRRRLVSLRRSVDRRALFGPSFRARAADPVPAPDAENEDYYEVTCTLPEVAAGDECTVSVLDQRDWGGCVDARVLEARVEGGGRARARFARRGRAAPRPEEDTAIYIYI